MRILRKAESTSNTEKNLLISLWLLQIFIIVVVVVIDVFIVISVIVTFGEFVLIFFLIQLHVLGFNWYTYKVSRTCLFFLFTLGSFHYPVGGGLLLPKSRRVLHPKVLIQLIDNQIMYRALTCKNLGQLPLGKYVSQM